MDVRGEGVKERLGGRTVDILGETEEIGFLFCQGREGVVAGVGLSGEGHVSSLSSHAINQHHEIMRALVLYSSILYLALT
jgi:hypothetical protein